MKIKLRIKKRALKKEGVDEGVPLPSEVEGLPVTVKRPKKVEEEEPLVSATREAVKRELENRLKDLEFQLKRFNEVQDKLQKYLESRRMRKLESEIAKLTEEREEKVREYVKSLTGMYPEELEETVRREVEQVLSFMRNNNITLAEIRDLLVKAQKIVYKAPQITLEKLREALVRVGLSQRQIEQVIEESRSVIEKLYVEIVVTSSFFKDAGIWDRIKSFFSWIFSKVRELIGRLRSVGEMLKDVKDELSKIISE